MVFEADGGILPILKPLLVKARSPLLRSILLDFSADTHTWQNTTSSGLCLVMQPGPRGKPGRLARPLHYLLFSKLTFGEDEL